MSKREVESEICGRKSNLLPVMQFSALFLSLFLCLVWALAKNCNKPHDIHAAFSTLGYLYLAREAFLYGLEIKHATFWVISLQKGGWDKPGGSFAF